MEDEEKDGWRTFDEMRVNPFETDDGIGSRHEKNDEREGSF
jgi:hypothetical protein